MVIEYPILSQAAGGGDFIKRSHHDSYPFINHSSHKGNGVFITGGSRSIGRSIAISFAKAGASKIALGDIRDFGNLQEDLERAAENNGHLKPKIELFPLDVTDQQQVLDAYTRLRPFFDGGLDVLINNAGAISEQAKIVDINPDGWWQCCAVNLKGTFLVSKHFVPLLYENPNGLKTVININSVASVGVRPLSSDYATSKFAILKFTEALLVEEAAKGLLAFSLHPGAVLSKMTEIAMPEKMWHLFEDKTELAGDTIAFLTQARQEWLAGRWLSCNWDMEEFLSRKEEIISQDKLKMRLRM